jgi:hypothetical protein
MMCSAQLAASNSQSYKAFYSQDTGQVLLPKPEVSAFRHSLSNPPLRRKGGGFTKYTVCMYLDIPSSRRRCCPERQSTSNCIHAYNIFPNLGQLITVID